MDIPADARRRIETDEVAWLTTVTQRGAPAPNPVWFVPEGDDLIVHATPGSVKVRNIARNPLVTLHFNSDASGGDVVIVSGVAELTPRSVPSAQPGFVEKYEAAIVGPLASTVAAIDAEYDTRIRIRPTRIRGV